MHYPLYFDYLQSGPLQSRAVASYQDHKTIIIIDVNSFSVSF